MSPDGKQIALGRKDGIWLVDTRTGRTDPKPLRWLNHRDGTISGFAFTSDGKSFIAARHSTAYRWDLQTKQAEVLLANDLIGISAMALSPDGKRLAIGDDSMNMTEWQVGTGTTNTLLHKWKQPSVIYNLTYSPSGEFLACGLYEEVKCYNSAGKSVIGSAASKMAHQSGVVHLAFNKHSTRLASGDHCGNVAIWSPTAVRPIAKFRAHDPAQGATAGSVRAISFSRRSGNLVSIGDDEQLKVWDMQGKLVESQRVKCPCAIIHDLRDTLVCAHRALGGFCRFADVRVGLSTMDF